MASEELKAMLRRWLVDERSVELPICTYTVKYEPGWRRLTDELDRLFEADGLHVYLPFNRDLADIGFERAQKAIKLNERRMAWVNKILESS